MNKIHAAFAVTLVALSAGAFAQGDQSDAARQQRMDDAYANSHGTHVASSGLREDTREAGHSIHNGVRATGHAVHGAVRATGHAVHTGLRATGHAIHQGVRATGHAIHEGVDKVTGK
jgi:hypothetical protein